jgi:hypothetical protein
MAKTFIHNGPHQAITSDSSPGLRFLKELIPALDSLDPEKNPMSRYLTPTAHFITNGADPAPADAVAAMMKMRSEKVQVFNHTVKTAWDVEREQGKRTVMYESTSMTTIKGDPDVRAIKVPEFSVIELEPMEGGFDGLGAYELRVYMDPQPVMQRFKEIGGGGA